MLIGNGRLVDKIPMTFLGRDWNGQLQPGRLPGCTSSENFGANAALPNGYYQPQGWMLPRKGGNLRAGLVTGSGAMAGPMQSGYNIEATITGDGGISSAVLGLIVSIAATLTAGGGITSASANALATMVATITGASSVTATLQGLADLGAVLSGSGSVVAGNTALMDITADIRGYGDLTPEGIRDSVWNAALANYQTTGSAGKALSTASSGGVDLNALAAAVWAYATRELTSGALSTEQAAQLAEIYSVHGLQLGFPLTVTETSRAANGVAQTISSDGTTTTVTRV